MLRNLTLIVAGLMPSFLSAQEHCAISDDTVFAIEKREASIPLIEYGESWVRAVGGKIRCEDKTTEGRLVCTVEGPGELVVVPSSRPMMVLTFFTAEIGEAHVYPEGDVSCGPKAEFDKYR